MPKGVPNKKYTGAFKQHVIEDMRENKLGMLEAERKFDVDHHVIARRERIYLIYGAEGLHLERRGRGGKGQPPKLEKAVEEDLIAENQRLRAEVAYLKNLQALVLENERHQQKKRR